MKGRKKEIPQEVITEIPKEEKKEIPIEEPKAEMLTRELTEEDEKGENEGEEKDKIREGLEKKISHRPEKKDLENRNILHHGHVAPSLQATQDQLEHERLLTTLEKKSVTST